MQERLQKVLAAAGVASRRDAEAWIAAGKVTVNGTVVTEPGHRVDPERDNISVDGRQLPQNVERLYLVLNKPQGYVTTREDPHAKDTVMDLILPALEERFGRGNAAVSGIHPVGRLDAQTEGLLLLTNDGAFTHTMTHPSHGVPKLYLADVRGIPDETVLEKLRSGIPLFGKKTAPARARIVRADRGRNTSLVEVELREGRNQQVRGMLQAVGHPVNHLTRVAVGFLGLGRLKPGQWRLLTEREVAGLLGGEEYQPPAPAAPAPRPTTRRQQGPDDGPRAAGPRRPAAGRDGHPPQRPGGWDGPRNDRPQGDRPSNRAWRPDDPSRRDEQRGPRPQGDFRGGSRPPQGEDRGRFGARPPFGDNRGGGRPPRDGDAPRDFRGGPRPPRNDDRPRNFERGDARPPYGEGGDRPRFPRNEDRPRNFQGDQGPRFPRDGDRPRDFQGDRGTRFGSGNDRGRDAGPPRGPRPPFGQDRGRDFRGGGFGGNSQGPRGPRDDRPRDFGGEGSRPPRDDRPRDDRPRDFRGEGPGPGGPRPPYGENRGGGGGFRGGSGGGPREGGGYRGGSGGGGFRGGSGGGGGFRGGGGRGPGGPRGNNRGGGGHGGRGGR